MENNKPVQEKRLTGKQLYMLMKLEARMKEFATNDLAAAQARLQKIEAERQQAIAEFNQVQGAITAGRIMIQQELEESGVRLEVYEQQKQEHLEKLQAEELRRQENNEKAKARQALYVVPPEKLNEFVKEAEQESAEAFKENIGIKE